LFKLEKTFTVMMMTDALIQPSPYETPDGNRVVWQGQYTTKPKKPALYQVPTPWLMPSMAVMVTGYVSVPTQPGYECLEAQSMGFLTEIATVSQGLCWLKQIPQLRSSFL
jgi:hypothetical protein